MTPRIKDVAAHAQVSTATVSRVLNGKKVKSDLEQRVRDSIAELHYSMDGQARSLRRGATQLIALILPDIENPFYTALARGVEDVAQNAGYSVVLCNSDENWEKEADYISMAVSERTAGVLIAPKTGHADVSSLLSRGTAVVSIDRALDADVDQIVFDNRSLGRLATNDLLQRGYRRICCISGPIETSTSADRAMGWRDAMTQAGLSTEGLLQYANFRVDGGREATRKLLAAKPAPDALLATNNLVGVGALQMLGEMGFGDLGLAVIGELPFATSHHPNAKYLPLNPRAMGEEGARMLLKRIAEPSAARSNVVLRLPEPRALTW